jgi:hypothetical protein
MRLTILALFVPALQVIGLAQTVLAPQVGLVSDGANLRPVAGIAAAAAVGSPITFARTFSQAFAAPSRSFGLGIASDTGELMLLTSSGSATKVPGVSTKPDRIQFSARGTAAVAYFTTTKTVQVIAGLPDSPAVRQVNVSAMGDPAALAVSDDGQRFAASWIAVTFEFGPSGLIAAYPPAQGLTYVAGGVDLGLIFPTGFQLGLGPAVTTFPKTLDPVGAVYENRRVIVASSDGTILTLNLDSGNSSTLDCQCAPAGVFATNAPAIYRVSNFDGAALKIYDFGQNAIWFAPLALGIAQ